MSMTVLILASANRYFRAESSVGQFGGKCTCPDGQVYNVGDHRDHCATLACVGGVSGKCYKKKKRHGAHMKVVCANPQVGSACYQHGSSKDERDAFCGAGLYCARQGHDGRNWGGCKTNPDTASNKIGLPGPPYDHHCCSSGLSFYMGTAGSQCPSGHLITTRADCLAAHRALSIKADKPWDGNTGHIPAGCSTRQHRDSNMHWNTATRGAGRSDLTPVCKGPGVSSRRRGGRRAERKND